MRLNKFRRYLPGTLQKFLFEGHDRSLKAKRNIIISFFIRGCSIFISLLLVPMTINYINPTRYGIWLTLSSVIGWFSFFDIGFGNGLRNRFAEAKAKGEKELARTYVSTTYAILSIIIGIVLMLFIFINPFLNWAKILNTPSEMAGELGILALIVFVFFCIQFVLQLINTVLTADQKPALASFFSLLGSIFSLLVIFILTKTTKGSLLYLGMALSFTPVIVVVASSLWFYKRDYKEFSPSFKYVKFSYAKDLMNLGIKFFFIQIAAIILFQTSNIIIAQLFGPAEVTPYNIAFKYFGIITMMFSIIIVPFWSAFTEAYAKNDIIWIKNIMLKLFKSWGFIIIGAGVMLIFANIFYRLWIGTSVKIPLILSTFMAIYVIINSLNSIFSQFLNGVGKIKLQLYFSILNSFLNIPLAIFLAKKIGIVGIISSTSILGLIVAGVSFLQYKKIINKRDSGIWAK
jgi:O-antigen/teichoic acid export membrane protein